jgi:two-component system sensor histidine kinase BaeS
MNIYKKLVLSLVGLTTIILIATLLLARWSFEQGFSNFLQAQEIERLSRISQEITQIKPNALHLKEIEKGLLERILQGHSFAPKSSRAPSHSAGGLRPRPPPPHILKGDKKRLYTAVFDLSGTQIAGDTLEQTDASKLVLYEFIIKVNEQSIGLLKSWKSQRFESPTASEFSKQQITTSILIGVFCLALAVVLSYFGARMLLAPIKLVINRVEDLSNGNYTRTLINKRKDEFGELINNVNHLGEVLEQTRSAKNRWFADISHELRTPLTVLMGELEALKMGIRPLTMVHIDSLNQEAQLLKRLIDDLYQLSTSDIGALRYEFAEVDVSVLLKRLITKMHVITNEDEISIEQYIETDVIFNCDKNRINQLLANLINNSLAYTDCKGTVKVRLFKSKNEIQISVEDSSPSLSENECVQIFEPLYRHNKARTRNNGGAGLGLAICKNIVEAHSGKISAKPSTLGGIEIMLTFPVSPTQIKKGNK